MIMRIRFEIAIAKTHTHHVEVVQPSWWLPSELGESKLLGKFVSLIFSKPQKNNPITLFILLDPIVQKMSFASNIMFVVGLKTITVATGPLFSPKLLPPCPQGHFLFA